MRTTVALDPDVHRLLQQAAHKRKRPFNQVLNEVVRDSLSGTAMAEPFIQPVFSLGRCPIDLTKALSLAADLEDQEILAKVKRAR